MTSPIFINTSYLIHVTKVNEATLTIDETENMKNDKVYLYTGREDKFIVTGNLPSSPSSIP